MAGIVFPVSTVYDVINYVAAWNNVPADVPSVALPQTCLDLFAICM